MHILRTFDNAIEAHMLRSLLEHEGIPSYVLDENIIHLNPLYNITAGGIKVAVSPIDAERANEIMIKNDQQKLVDDEGNLIKCPKCNSDELYSGFKSVKSVKEIVGFFFASLLFGGYPLFFTTNKKCKKCGTEFTVKSDQN